MSDTKKPSELLDRFMRGQHERPITCDKHGPQTELGATWFGDAVRWFGCPVCEAERDEELRKRRDEELAKAAEVARRSDMEARGIVGRMQDMTLDNYQAEHPEQKRALERCRAYAEQPEGVLILVGSVGTGKTHLAVGIAQRTKGTYVKVMRLLRNIRETYRKESEDTEQERIDWWARRELLVIDEVGVQMATDSERLLLYEIIDERYNAELPTVLVSNQTTKEMGELLGDRVMDRLAERGQVVAFTWESWRRGEASKERMK